MSASFQTRLLAMIGIALTFKSVAQARPYNYPQVRYQSAVSQSLGGVTLPMTDELGSNIFNNPAALARNTKFRAEYLNLNLEANSNVLGSLGLGTTKMTGLGGMTETLNTNQGKVFGAGLGNLTALSWGGLGVGLLMQERVRAVSDGTTARYETMSQIIPAAGYGLALARGVVRLGYSMQYLNQASGTAQSASDSSASFLSGINQGWAISHTASANFTFPFAYLPTFSIIGRNIGGLHYNAGSIFARAKNPIGIPADESMTVDAAMNFMVRLSGTFKSYWYVQYKDLTNTANVPFMERISLGADFDLSKNFSLRVGFTGNQPSGGIGFKSEASEINLAYYNEPNPFSGVEYWDTRYTLQYKIFFQDKNVRDRERENSLKGQ